MSVKSLMKLILISMGSKLFNTNNQVFSQLKLSPENDRI